MKKWEKHKASIVMAYMKENKIMAPGYLIDYEPDKGFMIWCPNHRRMFYSSYFKPWDIFESQKKEKHETK